jgi:C4-dicarboxylate transporter DctM subunit
MFLESLSMVLLTIPIFYPLVQSLDFDLIWFGIMVVVATEISYITPPVGMNVFVLQSVLRDVPGTTIFKGVLPFVFVDILRILLFVLVPWLVLVVPRSM